MDWTHASKYRKADLIGFESNGKKAGHTKAVSPNGGAGLFRYLEINEAGHMVPYGASSAALSPRGVRAILTDMSAPAPSRIADQPEVSLDFFTRWIRNESFE